MKTKILIFNIITLMIALSKAYTQDSLTLIATMTSEKTGDMFSVVSGVGDVNGDGYDDVLVSTLMGNYAKLYFGGSPFDTLADLKFVGEQPSRFGCSIAAADVNGDGFNDIIIGASHYCIGGFYGIIDAGKVYIYLGGTDIDTTADLTILPKSDPYEPYRYHFGYSVARAGDVNGDGYDDIIIGAPNDIYYGKAYIFYGDSIMDDQADVFIREGELQDMLGWSVDCAGDVNGDGFDDVIVGIPQDLNGSSGKAQLYLGGNPMDNVVDAIFQGEDNPYNSFGRVVSGLGDINNDGFDDFGIMSLSFIKVMFGNENLNNIFELKLIPSRDFWNLASCGDLNRDGFDDFITVSEDTRIFFGLEIPDTSYDLILPYFFKYVSSAGDINNDNDMEIILGERPDNCEKVFIYSYRHGNNVFNFKPIKGNAFSLFQNYPNPFNCQTIISYQLPMKSKVTIVIYNIVGKKIRKLLNEIQPPGIHKVFWNGKDQTGNRVSSGIYLCQIKTKSYSNENKNNIATIKLILTK